MDDSSKDKEKYVIISCNWGVQPKMLELKEFLASNGIKIWMDVDNMGNKMPVSMADAVENATLVLVAMTEKYQSSDLCYIGANYGEEKKVPIVPLLLQRGYKPMGWLGLLMTDKKYVDLSTDDYKQKFGDVLIEVNRLMNITDASIQNTKPAVTKPIGSVVTPVDKVNIQSGNIDYVIAGNEQVNVNIYSEKDNPDPDIRTHAEDFLRRVKVHFSRTISDISNLTSQPTKMILDEIFVFTHQTLQDFCRALHMLNLDPTEVRSLAAMTLQEDRMEMMRKLFYGIILDNKNTDRLRRYLEDRSCSVDECRDILFKQLVGLIPRKTITDIRLVHLLSECGNAAIDRTKTHVQNIDIMKLGLLPNDQITLATLIKQLAPLNSVYIREVIFHKFLDAYLKESPRHAKSYEVQRLTLQDEALAKETIDLFLAQLRDAGCKEMGLTSCCLTEEKLHLITERCKAEKTTLSRLAIYEDKDMPVTAYREISWLLQTTKCKQMIFGHCNLSSNRLREFGCGCHEIDMTLNELTILDKSMSRDAFRECATTLQATKCKDVGFNDCDLTAQKLTEFGSACLLQGLSLSNFFISDSSMTADAFKECATTLHITQCKEVSFGSCNLTVQKLSEFGSGCLENSLSLSKMSIWDSSMTADAFKECATTLHITQCRIVSFGSCNLTVQKLSEFGSGCLENSLSLLRLSIVNETMTEDGYSVLSRVVNASECSCLLLQNCDLNQNKLISFHESCRENNVTLTRLFICNNSIPADALRECATTLRVTECGEVVFFHCNLTVEKLSEFGSGCLKNGLSLSIIGIVDKTLTEDGYSELSNVIYTTKCRNLVLEGCDLNSDKLISFCNGCRKNDTTIAKLQLRNTGQVTTDVISALRELMIDVVESLVMHNCEVDDDNRLRLKDMLNLPNAKVKSLGLPNEDFIYKPKVQAPRSKASP